MAHPEEVPVHETDEPRPERRAEVRYEPDPLVPVFFAHPDAEHPTAGLIADVSRGGLRIVAPPMARPHLHWGDPVRLVVSYSESARRCGVEGLKLTAHVVNLQVDARGYQLRAQFQTDGRDGDWERLHAWVKLLSRGR